MFSVRTKVNSRLSQKLKKEKDAPYYGKELYFTSAKQSAPSQFPTLNVDSIGEIQAGNDLEMDSQNAIISTIELKSFTNTTVNDARNIIDKAGDVMISMGYSLIAGPEDVSDDKSKIAFARFRRTVGSGDILY